MGLLSEVTSEVTVPAGLAPLTAPLLPNHFVSVHDVGEMVVDVAEAVAVLPAYAELGFEGAYPGCLARASVVERLQTAGSSLPRGYALVVLDGHRTTKFQQSLVDHYRAAGNLPDGFVADPGSTVLVPPHTTGGAVDLTLSFRGVPLALGTDFDAFVPAAELTAFEGKPGVVRDLRRLLAAVLLAEGFVGYPLEWWHWSYGEQVWAFNHGTTARYGPIDT